MHDIVTYQIEAMNSIDIGLSALLIALALGIVFCGPARLVRWWSGLRRVMPGRDRHDRME